MNKYFKAFHRYLRNCVIFQLCWKPQSRSRLAVPQWGLWQGELWVVSLCWLSAYTVTDIEFTGTLTSILALYQRTRIGYLIITRQMILNQLRNQETVMYQCLCCDFKHKTQGFLCLWSLNSGADFIECLKHLKYEILEAPEVTNFDTSGASKISYFKCFIVDYVYNLIIGCVIVIVTTFQHKDKTQPLTFPLKKFYVKLP